jgi:hypothetical protein
LERDVMGKQRAMLPSDGQWQLCTLTSSGEF